MATLFRRLHSLLGLCLRALLPAAILGGGWYAYSYLAVEVEQEIAVKEDKQPLRTRVAELDVADYPVVVTTYGVVQAHNRVALTAEVGGAVTRVSPSFEAGAYFEQGEVLIEIDKQNYATALAMAQSQRLSAQSALQLAKLNEERKLRLIRDNAVSQAEVDTASATREQAEADLASAAAQLQQAELNLKRTSVIAPFDGRVVQKNVGVGQMAGPNMPLGEVFRVDFAEVRLPISGRQRRFLELPEFADDPPVKVKLRDAIDDSSQAVWEAEIVRTEGVLDADSRDLFAIARIDDPFGRMSNHRPLRIGQPVVAAISGSVLENVIALPRGAVRQLDQIVLVDQKEQTLTPLKVKPIWSDAEHVVVEQAAIPEGMWLATTHLVFVPTGARVEIIPESKPHTSIAESTSATGPAAAQ